MTEPKIVVGDKEYYVANEGIIHVARLAIKEVSPDFYKRFCFCGEPRKAITFELGDMVDEELNLLREPDSREISINYHGYSQLDDDLTESNMREDLSAAQGSLDRIVHIHSNGYLIPVKSVITAELPWVDERERANFFGLEVALGLYMVNEEIKG